MQNSQVDEDHFLAFDVLIVKEVVHYLSQSLTLWEGSGTVYFNLPIHNLAIQNPTAIKITIANNHLAANNNASKTMYTKRATIIHIAGPNIFTPVCF